MKERKSMNKRAFGFVALNLLFDIAEYAGIFFVLFLLLDSYLFAGIITGITVTIIILLQFLAESVVRSGFAVDGEEELKNVDAVRHSFDEVYGTYKSKCIVGELTLNVKAGRLINVGSGYTGAFNYKNCIFVAEEAAPSFRRGLIAHEMGHAVSGLTRFGKVNMRLSGIIANLLAGIMINLLSASKCKGLARACAYLIFPFFIILSLPNIIAVVPFMRADEYAANELAVSLGYGEELRCLYRSFFSETNKLVSAIDLVHPSIENMIARINKQMELSEEELKIYSTGLVVHYVDAPDSQKTKAVYDWYVYREKTVGDGYYSYMIGHSLENGNGTEIDREKAKRSYERALAKGFAPSARRLSEMYKDEGDISSAYAYMRDYTDAAPGDLVQREKLKELLLEYTIGIYDCKLVSPAGGDRGPSLWKARLNDGKLVFVISSGDNYKVIHGVYEVNEKSLLVTLMKDDKPLISFSSDEIITRERITFTGAIGKYTLALEYSQSI